jgi:voltage-gated potassium channel
MSEASTGTSTAMSEPATAQARPRRSAVRKIGLTLLTVIVPFVAYFAIPLDKEFGRLLAAALVLVAAASLIPLSIRQAQLVLRSNDPLFDAMRCIVTALVLLIISFSCAYFVLATSYDNEIQGLKTKLDALYFTVTILATVGFGDITATGQAGRAVVTGQMVINFAVLAVALRVVSWALKERGPEAFARRGVRVPPEQT